MDLNTKLRFSKQHIKSECLGIVLSCGNYFNIGLQQDSNNLFLSGNALIAHMMGLISEVGVKSICVSGNIENKKHNYIHNRDYTNGNSGYGQDYVKFDCTLGEIHSVFTHTDYTRFKTALILPIDMPLLREDILDSLFYNLDNHGAVCYGDNFFPLLIKIDPRVIKLIDFVLHNKHNSQDKINCFSNDNSLSIFLKKISTNYLPLPEEYKNYFASVNASVNVISNANVNLNSNVNANISFRQQAKTIHHI